MFDVITKKNRKFKKECRICGVMFKPNGYKNKLCDECRKIRRIEQNKINAESLRLFYKNKKMGGIKNGT